MPNIKVYGLTETDFKKLFVKIQKTFKKESYAEHIVVTRVESEVIDLNPRQRPYIQLELNCMRGYKQKVEKLKTLGLDIQVVKLYDFIQKI